MTGITTTSAATAGTAATGTATTGTATTGITSSTTATSTTAANYYSTDYCLQQRPLHTAEAATAAHTAELKIATSDSNYYTQQRLQ